MTTNSIHRIEKGWSGHFICASSCVFRRHTLLGYQGIFISVSTVGNMMNSANGNEIQTIGINRYFETMAFHSRPKTDVHPWQDADVSREISFNSPWSIDQPWKEQEANDMHEAVVAEISAQLLSGNKYEDPDSL